MDRPNFFCGIKTLQAMLEMNLTDYEPDIELTVDLIEAPYLFIYSADEDAWTLKALMRGELYDHKNGSGVEKGTLRVDRATGQGSGQSTDKVLSQNMGAFFQACQQLSRYIQKEKLQPLYQGLDPEQAGVMIEKEGEKIRARKVSGKERPDLVCSTLTGGTILMRPYMDDFWERSEAEMTHQDSNVNKTENEPKARSAQEEQAAKEAEKAVLAGVDAALAKARKAGAEYEVSAMKIEQKVSRTTINVSSQSSLNELRGIVKDCASACDKLYLAYQNLIHELDSELRGYLTKNPGAYAVKAVTGIISWLNEESRIQNNYAAQFDGIDLGQLVKKEYQPRPENLETERFWINQYNSLAEKKDAEARWAEKLREHKRLAAEEERNAKSESRKAEQETRDIIRNLAKEEKAEIDRELEKKKTEFQAHYTAIREKMDYCRLAKDLLFFKSFNYSYLAADGTARINYDENHNGCVVRKMHDLKQIVTLNVGIIGLGENGRCQLSNIFADHEKKYGLGACRRWRNVKKIAACSDSNQVIGLLEDGHCVATTPGYDCGVHYVSSWSDIVDIVCGQYYAAGLRKDGTVVISGTGTSADRLRKTASSWKNVTAIFDYSEGHLAALKEDGTVLPETAEMKEPATAAKNIIAIAKNSNGPVYLQADGTVVATKSNLSSWGGRNSEGYIVSALKNVVAIYTGKNDFAALCEDGYFRVYDDYRHSAYELNKGAPLFSSYKEYYQGIRKKTEDEELRAEWRAKNLCQYCGGELEKKLFGWKCRECGNKKDY